MEKKTYECAGRKGTLYCCEQTDAPLIILNNYSDDGSSVIRAMEGIGTPDCNLLVIGNLRWDHDMTPWYCPPISENDTPYTGGADEYLDLLLTQFLPNCRTVLHGEPCFTGIAGYSLAGLFALYAMYQCDTFDRVASMSGSLWFPEFKEYAENGVALREYELDTTNPKSVPVCHFRNAAGDTLVFPEPREKDPYSLRESRGYKPLYAFVDSCTVPGR